MRWWLVALLAGCGRIDFDTDADEAIGSIADYSAEVFADAPLAYFHLDESVGPVVQSATLTAAGVYSGNFVFGAPGAVSGSTSVVFDGSSTRISMGDQFRFPGQGPYTLEVWIRPSYVGPDTRFVLDRGSGPAAQEGYSLYIGPDYTLFCRITNNTEFGYASRNAAPPVDRWTYLVATFDGNVDRIYIDGRETSNNMGAGNMAVADVAGAFVIGDSDPAQFNKFLGNIDEVAIYDHALAADRVLAHHRAARP